MSRSDGFTRRGRLLPGAVCWLRGHRWESQPMASGSVVALCDRCRELVLGSFVDQRVLGLHDVGGQTKFGDLAVIHDVIGAASALVSLDLVAYDVFRADLVARPGASVDVLVKVAATLSRMVDPGRPHRALRVLAMASEVSAAQFADLVDGGGGGA